MLNVFKIGNSVITTQRAFRDHFILFSNDAVQIEKLILQWTENFKTIGSSIKINLPE